jgi:hypothetical protein
MFDSPWGRSWGSSSWGWWGYCITHHE